MPYTMDDVYVPYTLEYVLYPLDDVYVPYTLVYVANTLDRGKSHLRRRRRCGNARPLPSGVSCAAGGGGASR